MTTKSDLITRPAGDIERKVKAVLLSTVIGPLIGAAVAAAGFAFLPGVSAACIEEISEGLSEMISAEGAAMVAAGFMAFQGALASAMAYLTRSRRPAGE